MNGFDKFGLGLAIGMVLASIALAGHDAGEMVCVEGVHEGLHCERRVADAGVPDAGEYVQGEAIIRCWGPGCRQDHTPLFE